MSNNLEIKKQAVVEITKKFQDAKSVVVVNYSGLTVEQVTALRAQCRAANVDYCVLKNTLARRALDDLKIVGLDEVLNGPSAFAFGMEDAVAPAKILSEFIEKAKNESIKVKAGLMDGQVMTPAKVSELAKVPSRDVLLARLLGSLQSSVSGFVRVLDAIAKKQSEGSAPAEEATAEA
ncbi:MAG: 50S ribosomal protein L10 [Candidatus Limiplasma sp.]|nr:50S ribosomal protein L10 [Candidatus Limiplasma sp.]